MAGKVKGIEIEIGGNTKGLSKALNDVKKNTNDIQNELKQVERLLKLDPKNTELLAQKQKLLSDQIETTSSKLDALKAAKKKCDDDMQNGTEVNEKQYRLLQREIIQTEQELKSLEKEAATSNSTLLKVSETTEKIGKKSEGLGKKITIISGAAAAGLGGGIALASQFEDAFAKVLTIADTTEVSAEDLKKAIKDLSNETGIAATDIADNVYNAISAGQKTGDAVNFVSNATKLAKAGFTDSASALDILTTAMNAYGLEASEVTKVSDLLIGTQNLGKTTVAELSAAMGKVIPTAKANNVELNQLCTGYAILTANGIATAESTTYVNAMLNELGKGGTNVDKILREKTGASFSELSEQGSTLGDVLQILNNYAQENNKSFGDLWSSSEAGKAGLVLLGEGADTFNSKLEEMNAQTGATDSAFNKLDTNSNKAKIAINELKNVASDLGENALASLQPIIGGAVNRVKEFSEWFSNLSDNTKTVITVILAVIAAIAPALVIFGQMCTAISAATKAFSALNLAMSMNPIALVVVAIAALVAAFIALWNKSAAFRNFWISLWGAIKSVCIAAWAGIKQVWNTVAPYFSAIWDAIKSVFSVVADVIGGYFSSAWNAITFVWDVAVMYFQAIWDEIKLVFSVVTAVLSGDFSGAWELIKQTWSTAKDFFDGVWTKIKDAFNFSEMPDIGKNLIMGLWSGINDKVSWLKKQVKGVVDKIKSWFTGKDGFDEHSPSKWAEKVFKYVFDGGAIGLQKGAPNVMNIMSDTAEKMKRIAENAAQVSNSYITNTNNKTQTFTFNTSGGGSVWSDALTNKKMLNSLILQGVL